MGSGLLPLLLKSMLTDKWFTKNWLTLGRAVPPRVSKAPGVKASEYRTKKKERKKKDFVKTVHEKKKEIEPERGSLESIAISKNKMLAI